ncbi:hypothetical protein BACFIN_08037, partial [Bacteroides finegoldii DSM 17565]
MFNPQKIRIMELLRKLYKVYSPSGKERAMIKLIWNYTKRITGTK